MRVDDLRAGQDAPGNPDPDPDGPAGVSRATLFWYGLLAVALVGWFLWGWLVVRQGFVDSVGESAGAAFALLLLVSIVGTVRRSRR